MNIVIYWGLGIGDWGLGPIPNPQSPIPIVLSSILGINLKYIYYNILKYTYIKIILNKLIKKNY